MGALSALRARLVPPDPRVLAPVHPVRDAGLAGAWRHGAHPVATRQAAAPVLRVSALRVRLDPAAHAERAPTQSLYQPALRVPHLADRVTL
jgi:hypothetical protein